ncbi:MAG: metallophosphoesterase [Bacteroidales bacterium]|nr:metallophosphoesterase [Bacteroidales bacterium]
MPIPQPSTTKRIATGFILLMAFSFSQDIISSGLCPGFSYERDCASGYSVVDTTLHEAVISGNIVQVKRLLFNGCDINAVDEKGWTPLDYANKRNRKEVKQLLLELGAVTYQKKIGNLREGPHVLLGDSGSMEVVYLNHDAGSSHTTLERALYKEVDFPVTLGNVTIEKTDIERVATDTYPAGHFDGVSRILVVGDIHGILDGVWNLLVNNGVMDSKGNWSWGDGHLVFVGDVFDRGSKVTEALWLIYSLSRQAEKHGGRVHFILGNHEPMIFKQDYRYVTDDYYSICDNLGLSYSDLFNEKTLLGRWLRNMPVLIRINGYGVVHAGISEEVLSMELPLDTINKIIWQFHNGREETRNTVIREKLLGSAGLLWYRGFVTNSEGSESSELLTVEKALDFYGVSKLIIGHTEVDSISTFFDQKIIDVNIPKRNREMPDQALLITTEGISVVGEDGGVKKIGGQSGKM